MSSLIGVYGASGCGRGIMPLLRLQYPNVELVFIDDCQSAKHVNGQGVVNWKEFLSSPREGKTVSIAIADSKTREILAEKCDDTGIPLVEARAASVVQMDDVVIQDGACLSPFVTLTSNICIGRCFHANLYSYVEHDCLIGDFVTFGPGAKVNGNVTIGDHAYIGSGAVIRQGIHIGAYATVGMGAVVTRDVAPRTTVIGNPAKPMIED
ncbi:MAG: acetyltransferase [Rhodospirillaceae bacterium]|nr:acetyltransferase [Rhodospirillaceae bacterium]